MLPANNDIMLYATVTLLAVYSLAMLAELVLSRVLKKNYFSSHYLSINLAVAALQQLTDVFNKLIFIGAFIYVQTHCSITQLLGIAPIHNSNSAAVMAINFIAIILLADFCQYWLHRFSHKVNIMWAGHITHHSNTEYNFSVAVRQNALEGLYTWVFFMPLAFLGVPWGMFLAAYTISLIWQFLVHTRFINRLGWLEYFMSTPSHHRVHHGRNPQYIDKNYGAFFIIWDRMFGTFQPEVEEVDYGIVQPLQNNNPVWSNVHHHIHILKTARAAKTWGDKWRVVFGEPAFVPHTAAIPAKQKNTAIQFTWQPEKKLYVFINFLLTAAGGFWALNYFGGHEGLWIYAAAGAVMVASFTIFTALLENRPWADVAEIGRLAVIAFAGGLLLPYQPLFIYGCVLIGLAIGMLLFTFYIAAMYKKRLRKKRLTLRNTAQQAVEATSPALHSIS